MKTIVRCLGLTALLAGLAAPAAAQVTPLLQLNCTSSNWPACGWGPMNANAYFSRTMLPGAGPQGQTAMQLAQLPVSSQSQYYLGWTSTISNPAQGVTRYMRFKFKVLGPIALYGNGDVWSNKFIIIGDGDNPTGRVICNLRDNGINEQAMVIQCQRNIDGDPARTGMVALSPDAWHSIQIEMRSSTTTSSGDARIKIWLDGANANYSSPTTQTGAFQLNAINWGNVNIGYYANASAAMSSHIVYQLADVIWDDAFDANFHTGGGGGSTPPGQVSGVRIISAGVVGVFPLGILGVASWIGRIRRKREE
jgi:hypothetical protein